jgi:carbonic anhydrase
LSVIDDLVRNNEKYYQNFKSGLLAVQPKRELAVLTCMDSRLAVFQMLGLEYGDAHIIRNAGGIVTDDALRSLLLSHHLLGTKELMIINHTDCGLMLFREEEMRTRMQRISGTAAVSPAHFYAFTDLEDNVREQIQKVRTHPWIPKNFPVRGFVYDVRTGRLTEVETRR